MTATGRHQIKINNSDGKCLMENWVEERSVHHIEPYETNKEDAIMAKVFKDGHRGLLSLHTDVRSCTTHLDHFRPPVDCGIRLVGKREEMRRKMLSEKYTKQVQDQPKPEIAKYISETQAAHNIPDFLSQKIKPTEHHEYRIEQPVTIWTELNDKVHGMTQKADKVSVFHRSSAFTEQRDENANDMTAYDTKNTAYI